MITDIFLNECIGVLFGPHSHQLDMSSYQDLLSFFTHSKKNFYEGDLMLDVMSKAQLIEKTCKHMLDGGTMTELITSIAVSEKFNDHLSLIYLSQEGKLRAPDPARWQKTIQKLIAFCKMNTTFQRFTEYSEIVLDGNFETIEEVIDEWSDLVKESSSAVADYELKTRSDLVILDLIMPDLGGGRVYDQLKETNPDILVLLASGYSIDGEATQILERGCNGFIQKPFDLTSLSEKVRAILDQ